MKVCSFCNSEYDNRIEFCFRDGQVLEDKSESDILSESNDTFIDYLRMFKLNKYARALEEMPTVSMGSGAIAGGGINGPDDVKVSKKARKKYKSANKEEAENYHMGIQAYVNQKFNGMF